MFDFIGFSTQFKITVKEQFILYRPKFSEEAAELSGKVLAGEAWSFTLPAGEHENSATSFKYEVDMGTAATFMTFDDTSLNIASNTTDSTSVGTHSINFWLVDEFKEESD